MYIRSHIVLLDRKRHDTYIHNMLDDLNIWIEQLK